jgi:hypothetical protein
MKDGEVWFEQFNGKHLAFSLLRCAATCRTKRADGAPLAEATAGDVFDFIPSQFRSVHGCFLDTAPNNRCGSERTLGFLDSINLLKSLIPQMPKRTLQPGPSGSDEQRKWLIHARNEIDDPQETSRADVKYRKYAAVLSVTWLTYRQTELY